MFYGQKLCFATSRALHDFLQKIGDNVDFIKQIMVVNLVLVVELAQRSSKRTSAELVARLLRPANRGHSQEADGEYCNIRGIGSCDESQVHRAGIRDGGRRHAWRDISRPGYERDL